ncbi:MAG: DUF4956 domain-containing protein [Treponema sp.]|nr:DUF4956 domain-containing protein [Treponema sp.]MCR4632033.1 DUF4956 domain-containing protein [Treponema sp.]
MSVLNNFLVTYEDLNIVFNMLLGLIAGLLISGGYILANKNRKFSKNFVITVFLLPVIMTVVIPFIASDLKKTLSLAGVFALVRFRSIPGDSKDILYVFFSIASGLIIGLNSYFLGFVLVLVVSLLFVLVSRLWNVEDKKILKITIPEDMNYKDVFNDIFEKYLVKYGVKNVKTSNMGTLFTISYWVQPKNDIDTKAFIDELRTRNGNLNIIIENPEDEQVPVL